MVSTYIEGATLWIGLWFVKPWILIDSSICPVIAKARVRNIGDDLKRTWTTTLCWYAAVAVGTGVGRVREEGSVEVDWNPQKEGNKRSAMWDIDSLKPPYYPSVRRYPVHLVYSAGGNTNSLSSSGMYEIYLSIRMFPWRKLFDSDRLSFSSVNIRLLRCLRITKTYVTQGNWEANCVSGFWATVNSASVG
jgi:hypothetical protein